MPMLNGTLSLLGIQDVEKFAARVMNDELKALRCTYLTAHDQEDLHSYLITTIWILSERFQPGRSSSFSKWAYNIARKRVSEWFSERFPGRRRSERPIVLSLDHDGPGLNLAVSDSLPTPDRDPDGIPRVLTERREHRARDLRVLREAVLTDLAA